MPMPGLELDGRIALVTGGAGGIGRVICSDLAGLGATVVVADLDPAACDAVAIDLPGAVGAAVDLMSEASIDACTDRVTSEVGAPTILVNCAALTGVERFLRTDRGWWDRQWLVNLRAPMQLTQNLLPGMIDAGWGRIVYVSSDGARAGSSGEAVYASGKGGLFGFAKSIAREFARHGVTSNVVCPGVTDTPNTRRHQAEDPRVFEALTRLIPLKRLGEPEEVSAMISFLCTDRAGYTTGQIVSVNGGIAMS